MSTIHFTKEHEYVRIDGDTGTIGITDFAQNMLGDIVFVELPVIGKTFQRGAEAAVIESAKAASPIYTPVSGEIVEVNGALQDTPGIVNEDPLDKGWFVKIKLSNKDEIDSLMDEAAYGTFLKSLG
ncbi:MAG: glycine cleavage system protein GcvH [Methylovirgula sp.]